MKKNINSNNINNTECEFLTSVLGIYAGGYSELLVAVREVFCYNEKDVVKNLELTTAINKANSIAAKYHGTRHTIFKQIKSDMAIKQVKKIANRLGISNVNRKGGLARMDLSTSTEKFFK